MRGLRGKKKQALAMQNPGWMLVMVGLLMVALGLMWVCAPLG